MIRARLTSPISLSLEDEPLRTELEGQLTHELCKRGLGASLALLPVLWMMWEVAGARAAGRPGVTALFVAQAILVTVRLATLFALRARGGWASRRAFLAYAALSAAIGVGHGAIVVATAPALDAVERITLALCLIGINAIAVVSMAPSPTAYAGHSSWNLAALLWVSIAYPVPGFFYIFPILMVVYIAALVMMVSFVHASLHAQMLLGLKLREAALRDPLTGLRNRRAIHEAMTLEVARIERGRSQPAPREASARGAVFIVIDMDHFKRINDSHGHVAGDAVLAQLAALLLEATRRVDLVARWGGEEFLVVATDVDVGAPFPLPERIRAKVEGRLFALPGGKTLHCTCSIGVAPYPPEAGSPASSSWDQALIDADRALYAAKSAGRNRVVQVGDLDPGQLAPAA